MEKHIQYLQRNEIDVKRWNQCIGQSANGVVYAFSFYLDAMATNWDALVLNDYGAVMPLPWRKKWGFHYLYQPFLTAQLGIFGNDLSIAIEREFLDAIPQKFKLCELPLNAGNAIGNYPHIHTRKNYILPLSDSYEELYKTFRTQTRRNLKKAQRQSLVVKPDIPIAKVLDLAKKHTSIKKTDLASLHHFAVLYELLKEQGQALTYAVYAEDALLASAVFLFSHNRAYYILVGNAAEGRAVGASHFLIDRFIENHAETGLTLDFEGGDVESLAFFYSGFGANEEPYPAVKYNRLPFYIKWLKK